MAQKQMDGDRNKAQGKRKKPSDLDEVSLEEGMHAMSGAEDLLRGRDARDPMSGMDGASMEDILASLEEILDEDDHDDSFMSNPMAKPDDEAGGDEKAFPSFDADEAEPFDFGHGASEDDDSEPVDMTDLLEAVDEDDDAVDLSSLTTTPSAAAVNTSETDDDDDAFDLASLLEEAVADHDEESVIEAAPAVETEAEIDLASLEDASTEGWADETLEPEEEAEAVASASEGADEGDDESDQILKSANVWSDDEEAEDDADAVAMTAGLEEVSEEDDAPLDLAGYEEPLVLAGFELPPEEGGVGEAEAAPDAAEEPEAAESGAPVAEEAPDDEEPESASAEDAEASDQDDDELDAGGLDADLESALDSVVRETLPDADDTGFEDEPVAEEVEDDTLQVALEKTVDDLVEQAGEEESNPMDELYSTAMASGIGVAFCSPEPEEVSLTPELMQELFQDDIQRVAEELIRETLEEGLAAMIEEMVRAELERFRQGA